MTVREVAFKYAAKGAKQVQRKDKQVQSAVNKTAKDARKNSGEINRWMERNKTAIGAIAGASLAAMGAIISASPTARAELAGVRSAFTLFADDVINDVLPAGDSLTNKAFEIQEAYAELPDPVRETISALIIGAGAFVALAATIVGVVKIVGAFLAVLAPVIKVAAGVVAAIAGIISIKFILIALLAVLIAAIVGFVAAYILNWKGARDKTNEFVKDIYDSAVDWLGRVKDRGIELISDLVNGFVDWIKKLPGRTATWLSDVYDEVKDRLAGLRDAALGWGEDVIDRFINGLENGLGRLRDAMAKVRDTITDRISFDIAANDRMAERWGSDMMEHFAQGVNSGQSSVQQSLTGAVGAPSAGGAGGSTNITFEQGAIQIQGTGSTRRDGQRVGEEASRYIENQFGNRR